MARFFALLLGAVALLLPVERTVAFTQQPVRCYSQVYRRIALPPTTIPIHNSNKQQQQQLLRADGGSSNKRTATALQALPLAIAASPVGSIGILAFIVLVHEAGHYLAAKKFGVKVEEFSIGFGPKLLGFTYAGDEFNLRALPLGGYVKFPENYNVTEARLIEEADSKAADEFIAQKNRETSSSSSSNFGSRILNFVTLGALDEKLWRDEKERRRKAGDAEQQGTDQLPPWWRTLGRSKKTKSGASTNKAVTTEIEYYDDPDLLQNRPWQQRAVVLSAGVIFNLLLAFFIYFGQINFGAGLPVPQFDNGVVVSAAPRPDAAASGKLNRGDIIVGVNGRPLITLSEKKHTKPSAFDSQKSISDVITKIRETPDGESLKLSVIHPSKKEEEITVQPKRQDNGPQTIGVLLAPNFVKTEMVKTSNPIKAADLSLKYVTSLTKETTNGLLSFFAGFITGSSSTSSQVSGPIGLIKTGSEVVATKDWTAILLFAAAISINLGVINSIPLPALDGGQLVFVLAEAVTGRKVDQRIQEGVTGVAVLFLLLLSVGTFVGDLSTIFGR